MKIYINNFNLDILNNIIKIFKDKLINSEIIINVYTDDGNYLIDNKDIFLLKPIDKDIKIYNNYYENYELILDPSFYDKEKITSIIGKTHISSKIKKEFYKIDRTKNVQMIIEHNIIDDITIIPNDIYFEIYDNNDINDSYIKEEIIEFLSLLN